MLGELLGWEPPGEAGNWWCGFDEDLGPENPAELAVRALRAIYGQRAPSELSVTPPELSIPLDVVPHDQAIDRERVDSTAERVAVVADEHGVYLGRNADGVHTMEIDDEHALWLTSVWTGPSERTVGDDWVALCKECADGARWARAIVETVR